MNDIATTEQTEEKCSLLKLFCIFFKIGSITFGGGMGMLPILEKDLADKKKWTTKEQLLDYYAIGQSTPGIVAVNVATFIGYNKRGILGGCVATAGVVTPSIIIITIIALFLQNFMDIPIVQKAMSGINIAVAALLTRAVITFAKNSIKSIFAVLIALLAFISIIVFKLDTFIVILGSAILGIIYSNINAQIKTKKNKLDRS